MGIAQRLDDIGKPAWLGLMVLGFIFYWPVGLAVLAFLLWSGRMACWKHEYGGRWYSHGGSSRWDRSESWFGWHHRGHGSSGNHAFDEYRAETLRRLEEEQRDFVEFLNRLRFAKDKAEFDEFLAERRRRAAGPDAAPQA